MDMPWPPSSSEAREMSCGYVEIGEASLLSSDSFAAQAGGEAQRKPGAPPNLSGPLTSPLGEDKGSGSWVFPQAQPEV